MTIDAQNKGKLLFLLAPIVLLSCMGFTFEKVWCFCYWFTAQIKSDGLLVGAACLFGTMCLWIVVMRLVSGGVKHDRQPMAMAIYFSTKVIVTVSLIGLMRRC